MTRRAVSLDLGLQSKSCHPGGTSQNLMHSPSVSKLRLGWHNGASCDGKGQRTHAADGLDKLLPVIGET